MEKFPLAVCLLIQAGAADPPSGFTVSSAAAHGDPTRVTVRFSASVDRASAEAVAHYGIDRGVTVSAASRGLDLRTVTLTVTPLSEGVVYVLTVRDVKDCGPTPRAVPSGSRFEFSFAKSVLDAGGKSNRMGPGGDGSKSPAAPKALRKIPIAPNQDLYAKIDVLEPGDELVLGEGVYPVKRHYVIRKEGKEGAWISVAAAPGAKVTILSSGGENPINIQNSRFLRFAGLEIRGDGDAFKWTGKNSDIVVEDCHLHDLTGSGINCAAIFLMERLTVRRCHIHHTGGNGEGMYLGKDKGGAPVMNSIIEDNWIHDTGGDQGDGIELNQGGLGNIIRGNIVYNTKYPCILVENTAKGPPNVVERNLCWNSKDSPLQVNGNSVVLENLTYEGPEGGLRAIPVLERLRARGVLEDLAEHSASARVKAEAKAALARLPPARKTRP